MQEQIGQEVLDCLEERCLDWANELAQNVWDRYAVCRRVGLAGQRALNGQTVRAVDQLPLDAFITSLKNRTEVGSEHWD